MLGLCSGAVEMGGATLVWVMCGSRALWKDRQVNCLMC